MGKWAATRMESLVWEEKLDRIKAYSKTRMFRGQGHKPSML